MQRAAVVLLGVLMVAIALPAEATQQPGKLRIHRFTMSVKGVQTVRWTFGPGPNTLRGTSSGSGSQRVEVATTAPVLATAREVDGRPVLYDCSRGCVLLAFGPARRQKRSFVLGRHVVDRRVESLFASTRDEPNRNRAQRPSCRPLELPAATGSFEWLDVKRRPRRRPQRVRFHALPPSDANGGTRVEAQRFATGEFCPLIPVDPRPLFWPAPIGWTSADFGRAAFVDGTVNGRGRLTGSFPGVREIFNCRRRVVRVRLAPTTRTDRGQNWTTTTATSWTATLTRRNCPRR